MTLYSLPPVDTRRRLTRQLDASRDLPQDLVEQLWQDDADRLLSQCRILQTKPLCTVGRLDRDAQAYTLKRHTWGRLSRTARMLHRESVARKCWRVGRQLASEGVATPLPRARLEYGCGPLTHRSYLLTDFIPGTNLYRALRRRELGSGPLTVVAEQVVRLWQKLAGLKCTHNDLKPENFIIDDQLQVWLIDLEMARFHASTQGLGRRQQADLERLFHPRVWSNCPEEARLLADHFQDAGWGAMLDRLPVLEERASAGRLTVYVRGADDTTVTDSSVEDIAHEVVQVDAQFCLDRATPPAAGVLRLAMSDEHASRLTVEVEQPTFAVANDSDAITPDDNDWILLIEAGDRVTPDLAWEIQQRIAEAESSDAYRIPREALIGSDPLSPDRGASDCDLRLFRRAAVPNVWNADIANDARTTIGTLENRIEYVRFSNLTALIRHLNQCTSWSVEGRYRRGEQARLARCLLSMPVQFLRRYAADRYYDLGWNGLQLSIVETAFVWLEEVKLWRQTRQLIAETQLAVSASEEILATDEDSATDQASLPIAAPYDGRRAA